MPELNYLISNMIVNNSSSLKLKFYIALNEIEPLRTTYETKIMTSDFPIKFPSSEGTASKEYN